MEKQKTHNNTSPLRNCEIRQTKNFRLVLWLDVAKISSRSRSLLHFRRIASTDCQYLTDDALATRRRRPKPRESTGNRRFFSHEPPIVPHTNGKRHHVDLNQNSHSRGTLRSRISGQSTIQPEQFAQAGRSSRRNHLNLSPKKPSTTSYLGS